MANQPIPVKQANDMIAQYIEYMQKLGVDMTKQTQSISFTSKELLNWLSGAMPYADELRICEGVYPDGENAGRITVILWPYKNGKPATKPVEQGKGGGDDDEEIEPYNDGVLKP